MQVNPYESAESAKDDVERTNADGPGRTVGAFGRFMQFALVLTAATCSVAVICILVCSIKSIDPGQANIGAGIAMVALLPTLLAFVLAITNLRRTSKTLSFLIALLTLLLLIPAAGLFLVIDLEV